MTSGTGDEMSFRYEYIKVIEIKQNYKIKLPDAIIAATAMSEGCTLSDFKGIDVSHINPFQQ